MRTEFQTPRSTEMLKTVITFMIFELASRNYFFTESLTCLLKQEPRRTVLNYVLKYFIFIICQLRINDQLQSVERLVGHFNLFFTEILCKLCGNLTANRLHLTTSLKNVFLRRFRKILSHQNSNPGKL